MNPDCISLDEKNKNPRAYICLPPIIWHSEKGKIIGTENRSVVSRVGGKGYSGPKGYKEEPLGV